MDDAPPPPKRRPIRLLIGLVLLVAALVGAAVYAILSAPGPPETPPQITLTVIPGDLALPRVVRVTEASADLPLASFRVTLTLVNGTFSTEVFDEPLRAGTLFADGSATFSCHDLTEPERLSVGDELRAADFPPGNYGITLLHAPTQRSLASVSVWF